MNICVLTHTFPKNKNDSTAAFLHALVIGMKKSGVNVTVLTSYHKALNPQDFPYRVLSYKYIWPGFLHTLGYSATLKRGTKLPLKAYVIAPFLFIFATIKLIQIVKREKVDVISSHWLLPNGLTAAVASKLTGVPYTITLPGSDVYVSGMNNFFKRLAVFAANGAKVVLADSPFFLDKIKKLGAKLKQTKILPYPVVVDKYRRNQRGVNTLKKKIGFSSQNIIILAVGRLVEKKGFKYLIVAVKNILKSNNKIRLVIVGDGDLRNELEALSGNALNKYIFFAGSINRDKILSYYNMADAFVMPSVIDEGGNMDDQPVALLEAMSCGLPVIATNFPGISMTVEHNINGFLVPQKNVDKIETALTKLISSSKLRREMGNKSRKISLRKLSTITIGREYVNLFKEISPNK